MKDVAASPAAYNIRAFLQNVNIESYVVPSRGQHGGMLSNNT